MSILDGLYSLGRNINKMTGRVSEDTEQGIVSEKYPELKLNMGNDDLVKLTEKWERAWRNSSVYGDWLKKCEENEKYWLGNHFNRPEADTKRSMVDNAIFEALETYLPQITRRNPEPMITLRQGEEETEENLGFVSKLTKTLGDIADELKMRLKLKKVSRHWAIYLLGVIKAGWDMNKNIPTIKVIRGKKLILDPEATIDEDGYTGEYIGEYRKQQSGILLKILNKIGAEEGAEKTIKDLVKDDLGTEIQYIEWWTDEYMCWTLGSEVLLKKKNPHWNYDTEKESMASEMTGEVPLDEQGKPVMEKVEGFNHFYVPKKPYMFLSIFNLGKQPVDDTSLITQNLANQDRINKRVKQIDKNADSMNGGMVVSLERSGLTKDQAQGVTEAIRKGGTVAIPTGSVNDAIARMSAPGLPNDIYNDLADTRNRLSDIFGVRGSTPAGIQGEETVRGKLITRSLDTDRIGGGVSEYLEQLSDDIYNWFIQLLYVYDRKSEEELIKGELGWGDIPNKPKINASVKEGSLLPKDSITIANQAMELAKMNKLSLLDLYKRLDYPNPDEIAANVWLEANAPEILYSKDQRIAQLMQARQQAAQGAAQGGQPQEQPKFNMNYKDLPPEGKIQLAEKMGINLPPEAFEDEINQKANKPTK